LELVVRGQAQTNYPQWVGAMALSAGAPRHRYKVGIALLPIYWKITETYL
jgi:hypothetical protein